MPPLGGQLLAWIDRRDKDYVAGIINDAASGPVIKVFASASEAWRWVAAEAETLGVPIKWLDRTGPTPPPLSC